MDAALKILAVDNEPTVALALRYVFEGSRYEVTAVEDGNAALAELDAHPDMFDVIIVDQKMPDLTGLDLVGAIRKRGINCKVIVISAHLSGDVREAFERMDVHFMFPKPFDVAELRSAVDHVPA
jgi:CheY-like chemotaxis protein